MKCKASVPKVKDNSFIGLHSPQDLRNKRAIRYKRNVLLNTATVSQGQLHYPQILYYILTRSSYNVQLPYITIT